MKTIRLLPIVVLAASALLVLKTVGLVTNGGYTLSGVTLAAAQEAEAAGPLEYSEEQLAAAEAAAQAMFNATPRPTPTDQAEIPLFEIDGQGEQAPVANASGDTERVILERLAERRAELDALASELQVRLAVIEAAEVRIEERMAELSQVEGRINAMLDAREAEEEAQFAGLVAMYESMRPADAATIFNDLEMAVLLRVSRAMNPRKLGPILAKMLPVRAQELTVRMAMADDALQQPATEDGFAHLPQIVGQ